MSAVNWQRGWHNFSRRCLDEARLEQQGIQPVLEAPGHFWPLQVKIRYRETGNRRPDYVFTNTAEGPRFHEPD